MRVINLAPEHQDSYFCCLEEWSPEMQDAGDHKACWYHKYKDRGLRVKLALDAAEDDARARGAKGMAAWGLALPFWMKASWFKKHGYRGVDREFISTLVWKPFVEDAVAPHWIRQKKPVAGVPGKVSVTAFKNGWCPAQNITFERAKRAAQEFGNQVVFEEIDTTDPQTFEEWGIADGVFIDGKLANWGPPLSYDKLRKLIEKRVKRLSGA